MAEISFSIELVDAAGWGVELGEWLTHQVLPMFDQRVLSI